MKLPRGIEIGSNSDKISKNEKLDKIIFGKSISKYKISFKENYISYENDKSVFKALEIYKQPKILIQRIRNLTLKQRIIATYDDEGYLCTNTLRIGNLFNDDFDLKYILACLNSTTINFLFLKFFLNKDIYSYQLQLIPIVNVPKERQKLFSDKVDKILTLKQENPKADTSSLEKEIDQMVYKLYGLTVEEIAIVENS